MTVARTFRRPVYVVAVASLALPALHASGALAAPAVPTLEKPHLVIKGAKTVCFSYSAGAKGHGSDGGYRELVVNFTATNLEVDDTYTLTPLVKTAAGWNQIGAGPVEYGFKAKQSTYQAPKAKVTSAYAEDALLVPHTAFTAMFTLTNFGKGNDIDRMNNGTLKPGVSNKVEVQVAGSPTSTCHSAAP